MVKVSQGSDHKLEILAEIGRSLKQLEFGTQGAKLINDTSTSAHTEGFYAIQAISGCELDFTSGASSQSKVGTGMKGFDANLSIPNGVIVYGNFTKITLASAGTCIAYFNK